MKTRTAHLLKRPSTYSYCGLNSNNSVIFTNDLWEVTCKKCINIFKKKQNRIKKAIDALDESGK